MRTVSVIILMLVALGSNWSVGQYTLPSGPIDLQSNSSKLPYLTRDDSFYYLDTYINDCLSQIEYCENGFTLVFNLSMLWSEQAKATSADEYDSSYFNGRRVVASSGGESSFTAGGFYLHEVNVRGDHYYELGVRAFDRLFTKNIYLENMSTSRLACVWNTDSVSIYIDGKFYATVTETVTDPFFSLNFSPIKKFRTAISNSQVAGVNSAFFVDRILPDTDTLITGTSQDYFIGCVDNSDSLTVLESTDDCKSQCDQVYLTKENKCACLSASDLHLNHECSTESWLAYAVTHLKQISGRPIALEITKHSEVTLVNTPIGFDVTFLNTDSTNFRLYCSFDNAQNPISLIGNGPVFTEYNTTGEKHINITAVSLSNSKVVLSKQFTLNVRPKLSSEPLNSVRLLVASPESKEVNARIHVSGGTPFSCSLNFGDSKDAHEFIGTDRIAVKDFSHEYELSGLYRVVLRCQNEAFPEEALTETRLVYIKKDAMSTELDHFSQIYVSRSQNLSVELELPFEACSPGLKLEVVDKFTNGKLFDWDCVPNDGKLAMTIEPSLLTNQIENYLSVRFASNIEISSYLLTWQDEIQTKPTIKVLTENPRLDLETEVEVTVPVQAGSLVRIDFGDGSKPLTYLMSHDLPAPSNNATTHTFRLSHIYVVRDETAKIQDFDFTVRQANYISETFALLNMSYEVALSDFKLAVSETEFADISDKPIVFKLTPSKTEAPVKVNEIKFIFNQEEPSKFIVLKDYVFNAENNFQAEMSHVYGDYGIFTAVIICANSISEQTLKTTIKIGRKVDSLQGYIVNPYSPLNSDVSFFIKISGGNGYHLTLDLDDEQKNNVTLNWAQLKDKTSPTGMFLNTKYNTPGKYYPTVTVTNSFGSQQLSFCSHLTIVPERTDSLAMLQADDNCTFSSNLALLKNSKVLRGIESADELESFKVGKGIPNSFELDYVSCNATASNNSDKSDLKMIWYLNKINMVYIEELGKSSEYEHSISENCAGSDAVEAAYFKANELSAGDYVLKVFAFDERYPEDFVTFTQRIIIGASPLIIQMNNPDYIELNWNEQLEMDFMSESYDPDQVAGVASVPAQFELLCIRSNDQRQVLERVQNQVRMGNYNFAMNGFTQVFKASGLTIYEKECFKFNKTAAESSMALDGSVFSMHASEMALNNTDVYPMLFEVIMHKDSRVSVSDTIAVSLNLSSAFVVAPSIDLDEMEDQLDKVDDMVEKNPKKALGMLGAFASAINARDEDEEGTEMGQNVSTTTRKAGEASKKLIGLRGKMLGTVDKIIGLVSDTGSLQTAIDTTGSVTSNADQMPTENQDQGANVMASMGSSMKTLKASSEAVNNIAGSMLGTTGNVFLAASGTVPIISKNDTEIDLFADENDTYVEPPPIAAKITAPLHFYEMDTELFPEELYELEQEAARIKKEEEDALRKRTAEIAQRTFEGISNAGGAMASNGNNSGKATKLQTGGMALLVAKKKFNAQDDTCDDQFSSDSGPSIKMPALGKVMKNLDGSEPNVATKMFVSSTNPFQSSDPNTQANGAIVSMELADEDGNPIPVNNTDEPFVIKVPAQEPARSYQGSVNLTAINYYKTVLLTNISSLHVVVIPEKPEEVFHIYVKYSAKPRGDENKYPDEENYDYHFTVPNNKTSLDPANELRYTAFIGANETMGSGAYYIGVKVAKLSHETKQFKKSMNDTELTNKELMVNFTMRLFSTSCKYWSANTSSWLSDGCFVSSETTYDTTVCNCYHLTTFGSDFYVPPNTIDFGSVFSKFKSLSDNCAVFATVLSIFGAYILIAIFARWKDKKDLLKWGVTPLPDNLPTDSYYYCIQVQTGFGKECGTTSRVGMVLAGENSDSGVRKLHDNKRKAFKSGSICNFLMSTDQPLGNLLYLRIWHDNSGIGSHKSWHLNLINVVDLQTNEKSCFVCNDWLAVEKGDGLTDRVLSIACNKDMTRFKHLFTQSVKKKFTDNHLWVSVFSRPNKSHFTRLQRISCCMSVLFCTMIANAMFYKAESSSVQPLVKLGPLKFTMAQLFTSIIGSLIVVPVNLIVVTMFRKSKLKAPKIMPSRQQHVAKQQFWRQAPTSKYMFDSRTDVKKSAENPIKKAFDGVKKIFNGGSSESSSEYRRDQVEQDRNKKAGRNLPHWCIYVGWFLCIIAMVVPAFFVILYSMQWGKERSNAWLSTMVLSFVQSLFVIDPLKIFVITAVITFILRKSDEDSESIMDVNDPTYAAILNKDEEYLHKSMTNLSEVELREIVEGRNKVLSRLEPVSSVDLEFQRAARVMKIKVKEILREGFSYLCFLVVVLFLAQQVKSPDSNKVHVDLSRIFLNNGPISFADISTRNDFWNYVENVLIENLYSPDWYNNKTQVWREKLTITNRNAIRVGAARIRQLRVKDNTCHIHPKVKNMIKHCRGPYSFTNDDTKDYDIGWIQVNESAPLTTTTTVRPDKKPSKYKCQSSWCYQNSIQTKSIPIMGKLTTYKGGGYVVVLGRTRDRSMALIDELKNNSWIDGNTRAVFFEFTVFNPNVNLFSSFNLIVEFMNTGAAVTYQAVSIFSLYSYLGSFGVVVLLFQILFVIFVIYFLVHEILQIKKHKCAYFKEFWNLNEFVIIVMSIVSMAMFGMRTLFTTLAIKDVHETEMAGFVNFNTLAQWNEIYASIVSMIVFCASLKFLKLLRFNKRIGMLAATIKYSAKDLLSFSFTFGIFFFAFTMFGYCVFGPYMASYSNFMTSLESHFRFALGQYDFRGLVDNELLLGAIYFVAFILIVIMGLMSMFVAILSEAFEKVKEDMKTQKNETEVLSYIADAVKSVANKKGSKRSKERRVGDCSAPVTEDITSSLSITSLSVTVKEPVEYSHLSISK